MGVPVIREYLHIVVCLLIQMCIIHLMKRVVIRIILEKWVRHMWDMWGLTRVRPVILI